MGLDTIEFILEAEQAFGLEIPDDDAAAIETVGQFSRYIHNRLRHESFRSASEDEVFDIVRQILERQFRIDWNRISRESRFVKDLGLD